MEIEFIGVGEAFDPQWGNASYLIHSETKLLIDCGYAVPRNLFARGYSCEFIDAIYFTHFHADHCFGIAPLIGRWNGDNRQKPLTIIGQPGTEEHINQVIDLGYRNTRSRLKFELNYIESTSELELNELALSFARTDHSMPNYAINIGREDVHIGIGGDGGLTKESMDLYHNCQVLVHEAFGFDEAPKGHTDAKEVLRFAKTLPSLETLALVHLHRDVRKTQLSDFVDLGNDLPFELLIPEPGDVIHS